MKRLLLAALMLATTPAFAADLPAKAASPVLSNTFPYNTSGAYFGIYTGGASGSANVGNLPGINTASLTTFQAGVGGVVGYRWASANGNRFVDLETSIGFMNINGNTAGISLGGPIEAEIGAKVGAPMQAITALFPNIGLPNFPTLPLPQGVSALATQAYIGGFARFEDISVNFGLPANQEWAISPVLAVGVMTPLSNGTAIDGRLEFIFPADKCIGPSACTTMGQRYMAKASLLF